MRNATSVSPGTSIILGIVILGGAKDAREERGGDWSPRWGSRDEVWVKGSVATAHLSQIDVLCIDEPESI